ncbi:MAG TPA: GTP-binding protein, partial [Candidatus Hodarchaeales archaeon]|nr:GTP-binding protein [Candidatus Hodarchaeales archaeon]
EIIRNSSKLVRFIDLAGHEKYLRTTIYGLLGTEPDYVALIIDANRGIQRMTREHLGLVFVLKLPIFVVLNKVDLAPAHILKDTLNELKKLLKGPALSLIPKTVQDKDDITVLGPRLSHGRIVPIFLVSTVTGENLDLLRSFLNLLPPRRSFTSYWPTLGSDLKSAPFLLFVEEWFVLTGVGPVAVGIIQSGTIHEGDYAYLGPDASGVYLRSRVKSIQSRRISVASASVGQYISLALGFAKYPRQFSKGMVITTFDAPRAIHSFEAEIVILHHPTTIRPGYSAMIHAKTIRSQAKIRHILDGPSPLRTGDKARVEFEFLYSPQFLITGMQFIFREGRTKGLGVVRSVS